MRLHRGEVVVSRHQPQPFLLKFANRRLTEEAAAMRYIKHHGVVLNVRPWRSLEAALGAAMFFRVRLCLEGIPVHAWNPEIVERLIGRSCALECIDTNLLHPDDTRTIDVWAWTPNPSRIPKCPWLVFTSRRTLPRRLPSPRHRRRRGRRAPNSGCLSTWSGSITTPPPPHGSLRGRHGGGGGSSHGTGGAVDGELAPVPAFPPPIVPPPVWTVRQDVSNHSIHPPP
ncbi:uncharacterized protein LOC112902307 [Panicum hallii]|uniref:uncharacterized protein LOC112902307 n=1 Tax=Panicum hallii TaxID=206008 RepID=UPI000DF4DD84|nr:uncharacterized protein LOC112902307 [Panicum hallii]